MVIPIIAILLSILQLGIRIRTVEPEPNRTETEKIRTEPEPNRFCISRTEEPRGRRLQSAILCICKPYFIEKLNKTCKSRRE
ncbi:hypothetical protein BDB00DRAFT_864537 [Zychaea mexicana]|uniref:uncharacterized protein n=1 Tax=Zychaea mexicana TaxID=64656 RepID=UPI0022FE4730|nr:uncharacterized protein BDB00DRAFT_864537 [Zychaea mexicana]KAI9467734.1 hypothetical protein BDB00DRAFT_864537 [Zychaea mexicana]